MSKLTIKFSEIDSQTNELKEFTESFECNIQKNIIKYIDANKTQHEIEINEDTLKVSSNGVYEVVNTYNVNEITELELVLKDQNQKYKLGIKTSILEICETNEQINIEIKYSLFDDDDMISNHHIFMEVEK